MARERVAVAGHVRGRLQTPGRVALGLALAWGAFGSAVAQQPAPPPMPPKPMPTAPAAPPPEITGIVGGDVWTVTKGVIRGGTVIVRGAKIDKIGGPELALPPGAKVIDARGKVVAPGFVTTQTSGGFGGGLAGPPGSKIKDSLDPFALAIALALASGVTTGYVPGSAAPGGDNGLTSSNAAIKMTAGDLNSMLVSEPAMSTFSLGRPDYGGFYYGRNATPSARFDLREQLRKAKEYQQKFAQYEKNKKAGKQVTEPKKPGDIDAALPLIRKERMLRMSASQVADIRWALSLVDDFDIRMVIAPATEAWIIADEVAKRHVLLIITARSRALPDERKNGPSGTHPDAPGILHKAGVRFAVLPPDSYFDTGGEMGRDLLTYPLEGAFAMRGGLDAQSALEALTIVPAQILGLDNRIGSLEEGKDADILIMNGDPLDYRTFVEKTFVNGKLLYDKDKSSFYAHVRQKAIEASASEK
jgi:imidazolonepropionase-like amidohydrolase